MSWDVSARNMPEGAESVEDIPDDFEPEPFGTRAEVVELLGEAFPEADTSDPAWVTLRREGVSIEFNLGDEGPLESAMLHVRGGDNEATMAALARVAAVLDVDLMDITRGEKMGFEEVSEAGFEEWKAFRDEVIGES